MKIEKISCTGSKPMYSILLENGKYHGEYYNKDGFKCFQAWDKKKNAQRMLDILKSGKPFETVGGGK